MKEQIIRVKFLVQGLMTHKRFYLPNEDGKLQNFYFYQKKPQQATAA